ncbi:hypothetical protein AeMF1_005912 [Aphanomyces euteiches]|nr:hypothetical protein AeMF1_005912 [Aphanomyces euteiches]
MKRIKSVTSVVPVDIVVNVAFFIPDWATLLVYLKALDPAGVLGPLEHLWQLYMIGWNSDNLWPHLDLTRGDEDSQHEPNNSSSIYYPKDKLPLGWDVYGRARSRLSQQMAASSAPKSLGVPKLASDFFLLHSLVSLDWPHCTDEVAAAVFKFAASSLTLRKVKLSIAYRHHPKNCCITASMAQDFLDWITLQPVQDVSLKNFSWATSKTRDSVVAALLSRNTLQTLEIRGGIDAFSVTFDGKFERTPDQVILDFSWPKSKSGYGAGRSVDVDDLDEFELNEINEDLSGFLRPFFQTLLDPKVKTFRLSGYGIFQNDIVWKMLVPFLRQSHLGDGVRPLKTLRTLVLTDNCFLYGLKYFKDAVASLEQIVSISYSDGAKEKVYVSEGQGKN